MKADEETILRIKDKQRALPSRTKALVGQHIKQLEWKSDPHELLPRPQEVIPAPGRANAASTIIPTSVRMEPYHKAKWRDYQEGRRPYPLFTEQDEFSMNYLDWRRYVTNTRYRQEANDYIQLGLEQNNAPAYSMVKQVFTAKTKGSELASDVWWTFPSYFRRLFTQLTRKKNSKRLRGL
jgi:hypothetical protein